MSEPSAHKEWTPDWVLAATDGRLLPAYGTGESVVFRGFSTDSRTIAHLDLFIALTGPNFDGHDFLALALESGAAGLLVREGAALPSSLGTDIPVIAVRDPLSALGDLAAAHRLSFSVPLVAITGSMGKTTVKDMLGDILKLHFQGRVLVTPGNFNNLVGMPRVLLDLQSEHRAVVLELGMSMRGEIRRLAHIARPDLGIITNISEVHMEHLTSMDAIAKAKGELLEGLGADKIALLNADDPRTASLREGRSFSVKTFGVNHPADAKGGDIRVHGFEGIEFTLDMGGESAQVFLSCVGRHNVWNALAAALAAFELGVPLNTIVRGLEAFRPPAMRCRILDILRVKVIDDTYNANPRSMDAALSTLEELAGEGRRIVVVGDMKELGRESVAAHRRLGRHAAKSGADYLFALGEFADHVVAGAREEKMPVDRTILAENHQSLVEALRDLLNRGDVVLVKGSRTMRMELVVRGLKGESIQ